MRHRALALPRLAAPVVLVVLGACYIDDPLVYLSEDAGDAGADAGGGSGGTGGRGGAGGTTPDAPPCVANLECDDANPCTTDVCTPTGCTHDLVAAGTVCGSNDACTGVEACNSAGSCVKGAAAMVDDGDACTTDACDASTGVVTHTPIVPCTGPIATTGAPEPRYNHTALWTGSQMLVWGGSGKSFPSAVGTGGRYDPATNTWTPITANGAPPARHSHCAEWTGSKMIVWGGFGTAAYETTGGVYDPATDSWSPMTTTGAPSGRVKMACAWTGKELVVWGGTSTSGVTGSGGRYDPATNTWKPLPSAGAPTARYGSSAVWTGTRVIVWGGNDLFDWHKDGVSYDPAANAWTGFTPFPGAPEAREQHTAIWTGSRMVVWGGFTGGPYINTGGSLDPVGAAWVATTTTGAPSPRTEHTAVWTGTRMIVWGGCGMDSCTEFYGDGGAWTPDATGGAWTSIAASASVAARRGATAVWTGNAVILWGGRTSKGETDTGGILHP